MKCGKVFFRVSLIGSVLLGFWAGGVDSAVTRYSAATPHTPKYIPLGFSKNHNPPAPKTSQEVEVQEPAGLSPAELILTVFRTILDVVRGINAKKKAAKLSAAYNATKSWKSKNRTTALQRGRGFEDDFYDEHHDFHHEETTTPKPMKQSRYTDPWAGYYDFIINEGSFKFWSAFQLFTTAVLFYSCLSAIYYSKFNPVIPDYDREYDDYFLERSSGRSTRSVDSWELPSGLQWMNSSTFLFILDAISKHYENET